jgi:ribosomal protein L4
VKLLIIIIVIIIIIIIIIHNYLEMKVRDTQQITHDSKTWTTVTGSGKEAMRRKILVEKPK